MRTPLWHTLIITQAITAGGIITLPMCRNTSYSSAIFFSQTSSILSTYSIYIAWQSHLGEVHISLYICLPRLPIQIASSSQPAWAWSFQWWGCLCIAAKDCQRLVSGSLTLTLTLYSSSLSGSWFPRKNLSPSKSPFLRKGAGAALDIREFMGTSIGYYENLTFLTTRHHRRCIARSRAPSLPPESTGAPHWKQALWLVGGHREH